MTLVIRLSVTAKKADKTKHYLIGDNVAGHTHKTVSVSADQETLFVCKCDGTFYELPNPLKADTTHLLAVEWNTGVENGSRIWLDGKRISTFTTYVEAGRHPFAWYTLIGGKHIYDTEEGFIGKLYHFGMYNNRLSDFEKFATVGYWCDLFKIQLDVS